MISTQKSTILVVDDTPDNLKLMSGLLKDDYKVKIVNSGEFALEIAQSESPPDLILLDIMMPEMDGYAVCFHLKANPKTQHIPVIFLTAKTEIADETKGFELGAADYITKPISPSIVLSRVKTHLAVKKMQDMLRDENSIMKKMQDFLNDKNSFLESEIQKRTAEIIAIQDVTIHAMASLAETRDSDTGNHIRRTQQYVKVLAEKLRKHERFAHFLDDDKIIEMLFKSAPLHDIGKVGIPDKILLKPGKFTPEEFEIMKTHTTLGRNAIQQAERDLGLEVPFLKYAKEIAYYHQEKWDGSGYPEGLIGDAIPISARLMAVADVYDALISRRVYKMGMPHEKAVQIISEGKGTHFDPDMVEAFLELLNEFRTIAERYADSDADIAKKADYLAISIVEEV
jgi:putative two-component system response regulator